MSEQSPYEQLGVTESASFDEIQAAKQLLLQQYQDDAKVLEAIETAYDSVIMDRLRMRQEGKIKVPDRIRFPEKSSPPKVNINPLPLPSSPAWTKGFLDRPTQRELLVNSGVFAALAAISLFVEDARGSILPLILALGVFATIFFLNRKENRFGRALLLTLLGLLLGIGLGAIAMMGISLPLNPAQVYSLITFIVFWLLSNFVR